MIRGIGHAAITVKDMDRSVAFYTQALGFTKAFEIPNPENGNPWIVYLNIREGQFIELFYDGTEEITWKPEHIGFNHLCFEVDDIRATARQVKDAGFKMDVEPQQGCDFNWQAWTTDPNGIRVELMQMDPRSPHWKYM